MGTKHTYGCTKCSYSALTSGKLDYGFVAVVEPYICNDCKELTDVLVGKCGEKYEADSLILKKEKEYCRCSECNGKNITIWDTKKKPCPKCGTRMKIIEGESLCWD